MNIDPGDHTAQDYTDYCCADFDYTDHLEEIRQRLIYTLLFLLFSAILCFYFIENIIVFLKGPINSYKINLHTFKPQEKFLSYLKVSFYSGLFITTPLIFYHFFMFIKPALKDKEKKYFYSALFLIPLVFFLGTIFAYKILAPIAFGFFINFASSDNVSPVWSFSEYLDLLVMFMLISGAVFQTPLILVILMALKIITIGMLRHFRPWIIIFIFIFSALLTPPDVVSQLLLSALFYVFFEIAILAGKYV